MKNIIVLFLFLFSIQNISEIAKADDIPIQNVGRAPFGLTSPKFRCDKFLSSLDHVGTINFAFLYNTFGNKFDCLKTLLHDPRLQTLEVNLINEPCVRNNRCGKYEFLSGISIARYNQLLINRDESLHQRFLQYILPLQVVLAEHLQPNTTCLINPGLESNVSPQAAKTLVEWAKGSFFTCKIVWNPLKRTTRAERSLVNADLIEGHGPNPPLAPLCVVNLDGSDINFPGRPGTTGSNSINASNLQDFIRSYSFCSLILLWGHEDNCNGPRDRGFRDPRSRTCDPGNFNGLVSKEIVKFEKHLKPVPQEWTVEENLSLSGCKTMLPSSDGVKKGFVWKGSDAHVGAVALLTSAERSVRKVELFYKGIRLWTFYRAGIFTEDQWRNRTLWRTADRERRDIEDLPYHVVLKEDNGRFCRQLTDPTVRND